MANDMNVGSISVQFRARKDLLTADLKDIKKTINDALGKTLKVDITGGDLTKGIKKLADSIEQNAKRINNSLNSVADVSQSLSDAMKALSSPDFGAGLLKGMENLPSQLATVNRGLSKQREKLVSNLDDYNKQIKEKQSELANLTGKQQSVPKFISKGTDEYKKYNAALDEVNKNLESQRQNTRGIKDEIKTVKESKDLTEEKKSQKLRGLEDSFGYSKKEEKKLIRKRKDLETKLMPSKLRTDEKGNIYRPPFSDEVEKAKGQLEENNTLIETYQANQKKFKEEYDKTGSTASINGMTNTAAKLGQLSKRAKKIQGLIDAGGDKEKGIEESAVVKLDKATKNLWFKGGSKGGQIERKPKLRGLTKEQRKLTEQFKNEDRGILSLLDEDVKLSDEAQTLNKEVKDLISKRDEAQRKLDEWDKKNQKQQQTKEKKAGKKTSKKKAKEDVEEEKSPLVQLLNATQTIYGQIQSAGVGAWNAIRDAALESVGIQKGMIEQLGITPADMSKMIQTQASKMVSPDMGKIVKDAKKATSASLEVKPTEPLTDEDINKDLAYSEKVLKQNTDAKRKPKESEIKHLKDALSDEGTKDEKRRLNLGKLLIKQQKDLAAAADTDKQKIKDRIALTKAQLNGVKELNDSQKTAIENRLSKKETSLAKLNANEQKSLEALHSQWKQTKTDEERQTDIKRHETNLEGVRQSKAIEEDKLKVLDDKLNIYKKLEKLDDSQIQKEMKGKSLTKEQKKIYQDVLDNRKKSIDSQEKLEEKPTTPRMLPDKMVLPKNYKTDKTEIDKLLANRGGIISKLQEMGVSDEKILGNTDYLDFTKQLEQLGVKFESTQGETVKQQKASTEQISNQVKLSKEREAIQRNITDLKKEERNLVNSIKSNEKAMSGAGEAITASKAVETVTEDSAASTETITATAVSKGIEDGGKKGLTALQQLMRTPLKLNFEDEGKALLSRMRELRPNSINEIPLPKQLMGKTTPDLQGLIDINTSKVQGDTNTELEKQSDNLEDTNKGFQMTKETAEQWKTQIKQTEAELVEFNKNLPLGSQLMIKWGVDMKTGMLKPLYSIQDATKQGVMGLLNFQMMAQKILHYITFSIGVQLVMMFRQAFQNLIQSIIDFEKSAINTASVAGYLGASFDNAVSSIENLSKEIGKKTIYSANAAASALYNLASAGINVVKKEFEDLAPIINYATATGIELDTAFQAITKTIRQFGLEFEDAEMIVDSFTGTITHTYATAEKLVESYKYVGSIAGELGQDFNTLNATLGILYNRGLEAGQAGQRLNMIYTKLLKPTDDSIEILEKMGLTLSDINPYTNDLVDIFRKLRAAQFDAGDAATFFRARTAASALILMNEIEGIETLRNQLRLTQGLTEDIASKQLTSMNSQLALMGNRLEEAGLELSGTFAPIISYISNLIKNSLVPSMTSFSAILDGTVKVLTNAKPAIDVIAKSLMTTVPTVLLLTIALKALDITLIKTGHTTFIAKAGLDNLSMAFKGLFSSLMVITLPLMTLSAIFPNMSENVYNLVTTITILAVAYKLISLAHLLYIKNVKRGIILDLYDLAVKKLLTSQHWALKLATDHLVRSWLWGILATEKFQNSLLKLSVVMEKLTFSNLKSKLINSISYIFTTFKKLPGAMKSGIVGASNAIKSSIGSAIKYISTGSAIIKTQILSIGKSISVGLSTAYTGFAKRIGGIITSIKSSNIYLLIHSKLVKLAAGEYELFNHKIAILHKLQNMNIVQLLSHIKLKKLFNIETLKTIALGIKENIQTKLNTKSKKLEGLTIAGMIKWFKALNIERIKEIVTKKLSTFWSKKQTSAFTTETVSVGLLSKAIKVLGNSEKVTSLLTKGLTAALSALPFFALMIAIDLLITHWEDITNAFIGFGKAIGYLFGFMKKESILLDVQTDQLKDYRNGIARLNNLEKERVKLAKEVATMQTTSITSTTNYTNSMKKLSDLEEDINEVRQDTLEIGQELITSIKLTSSAVDEAITAFVTYQDTVYTLNGIDDRRKDLLGQQEDALNDYITKLTEEGATSEKTGDAYENYMSISKSLSELEKENNDTIEDKIENYDALQKEIKDLSKEEALRYSAATTLYLIQTKLIEQQEEYNKLLARQEYLLRINNTWEKVLEETLKQLDEKMIDLLEAEEKLYKLRQAQPKLLDALFQAMAQYGLVNRELIDAYKELKIAEGELIKSRIEYFHVMDDLSKDERTDVEKAVEKYKELREAGVDVASAFEQAFGDLTFLDESQLESIRQFAEAEYTVSIKTEGLDDIMAPLVDQLKDFGNLPDEIVAALTDLQKLQFEVNVEIQNIEDIEDEMSEVYVDVLPIVSGLWESVGKSFTAEDIGLDLTEIALPEDIDLTKFVTMAQRELTNSVPGFKLIMSQMFNLDLTTMDSLFSAIDAMMKKDLGSAQIVDMLTLITDGFENTSGEAWNMTYSVQTLLANMPEVSAAINKQGGVLNTLQKLYQTGRDSLSDFTNEEIIMAVAAIKTAQNLGIIYDGTETLEQLLSKFEGGPSLAEYFSEVNDVTSEFGGDMPVTLDDIDEAMTNLNTTIGGVEKAILLLIEAMTGEDGLSQTFIDEINKMREEYDLEPIQQEVEVIIKEPDYKPKSFWQWLTNPFNFPWLSNYSEEGTTLGFGGAKGMVALQKGAQIVDGPQQAIIGEAGAEAVVPLEGSNRKYGKSILQKIIPRYFPDLAMMQTGGLVPSTKEGIGTFLSEEVLLDSVKDISDLLKGIVINNKLINTGFKPVSGMTPDINREYTDLSKTIRNLQIRIDNVEPQSPVESNDYIFYGDIVINEASDANVMIDKFFDELSRRKRSSR